MYVQNYSSINSHSFKALNLWQLVIAIVGNRKHSRLLYVAYLYCNTRENTMKTIPRDTLKKPNTSIKAIHHTNGIKEITYMKISIDSETKSSTTA
jgi:hypothetical protein